MIYDCAIIGGGPAGLNAALVLGRARRKVALLDNNQPRNAVTHASHGFLTRDGITPYEFRRIAYEEVTSYPSVEHHPFMVMDIQKIPEGFLIMAGDQVIRARKLLITTGMKETVPDIPGLKELYGKSLFHCPYCDGWELRDRPLIVIAENEGLFHLAKLFYNWSRDLVICSNGRSILTDEQKQKLIGYNITVSEKKVAAFHGEDGILQEVEFVDGSKIRRTGGFVTPNWQSNFVFSERLGLETNALGGVIADATGKTGITGIFAAGEAASGAPSQLIVAAAAGSVAAASLNLELTEEEFSQ
ncbi:NAD(P)/FAD-dependent oxidoreductase [Paenibacillus sp. 1A_MP2]|uniref:NAD(P)/FAD-dependent oxidoreductase n=1 Tax=Paenibacillus sp. 1A_MP2 TaxID=3457495 RepID=UPI003FCD9476